MARRNPAANGRSPASSVEGAAAGGGPLHRPFTSVYGVDFSGAKLAGRFAWLARLEPPERPGEPLRLVELASLERLCGSASRDDAIAYLVGRVRASRRALWAIDAPFSLPVEVLEPGMGWPDLLAFVRAWERGGYALGLWCLERARALGGRQHIYRATDLAVKAPFDCYHYRIIYQTYHAMRDVCAPLARAPRTAILPFQYGRLASARRVVVEACPSSTLKRLGLPHHNYKQPEGGPLTPKRRRTRRRILEGLARYVAVGPAERWHIMRNGGGDALDAVLAGVGVALAWGLTDHARVAADGRALREGFVYA